jgi:hypothetical protein
MVMPKESTHPSNGGSVAETRFDDWLSHATARSETTSLKGT